LIFKPFYINHITNGFILFLWKKEERSFVGTTGNGGYGVGEHRTVVFSPVVSLLLRNFSAHYAKKDVRTVFIRPGVLRLLKLQLKLNGCWQLLVELVNKAVAVVVVNLALATQF
jgi:hypothetical protein